MPDPERSNLAEVLRELCHAIGADAGGALYLDGGDGTLRLAVETGGELGAPSFFRRLRSLTDRDDSRRLILRLGGSSGGICVLSRRAGGQFTQQDLTVAQLFARRLTDDALVAAAPVARSGWTRQLEAIQRIAARLTRLATVDQVAATICSETRTVIDHDEAHVLLADTAGVLHAVAACGRNAIGECAVPPLPADGPSGERLASVMSSGVAVLVDDMPDLGPARPGSYSMLIVPLHYEGRLSGAVCLVARGQGRFDDDDERLMQILADQAAVAIENARLLQGRDAAMQELAGLLEMSQAAGSAQDERSLAALLATRLRSLTSTDAALVSRWDEGSTVLHVISREGLAKGALTIDVAASAIRRQVLRDGRAVVVHADSPGLGSEAQRMHENGVRTMILVPLDAGGRTIGMIELLALRQARHPSDAELHACEAMASLAATGLEKVRVLDQLRSAADVDLVTGVHNHRYLQERLRQEVARSARSHSPLALLMLDLDRFKPVNDRHGHADGDRVLHNIAATIKDKVRASDIVARYGGDEFVVLMPDTTDGAASRVARRVVGGVLEQRHGLSDGTVVTVGVSAGLAVYPVNGRTSAQLLQAADAAMYDAKRAGGRRIERPTRQLAMDLGEPLPARAMA